VVFPRLSGWAGTVVNNSTQHWRGLSDTSFSCEKVYKAILTLTLTKQALRHKEAKDELIARLIPVYNLGTIIGNIRAHETAHSVRSTLTLAGESLIFS